MIAYDTVTMIECKFSFEELLGASFKSEARTKTITHQISQISNEIELTVSTFMKKQGFTYDETLESNMEQQEKILLTTQEDKVNKERSEIGKIFMLQS